MQPKRQFHIIDKNTIPLLIVSVRSNQIKSSIGQLHGLPSHQGFPHGLLSGLNGGLDLVLGHGTGIIGGVLERFERIRIRQYPRRLVGIALEVLTLTPTPTPGKRNGLGHPAIDANGEFIGRSVGPGRDVPIVVKAVAMDAAVTEAAAERGLVGLEETVGADVGGVDAEETLVAEKNDAPFAA